MQPLCLPLEGNVKKSFEMEADVKPALKGALCCVVMWLCCVAVFDVLGVVILDVEMQIKLK